MLASNRGAVMEFSKMPDITSRNSSPFLSASLLAKPSSTWPTSDSAAGVYLLFIVQLMVAAPLIVISLMLQSVLICVIDPIVGVPKQLLAKIFNSRGLSFLLPLLLFGIPRTGCLALCHQQHQNLHVLTAHRQRRSRPRRTNFGYESMGAFFSEDNTENWPPLSSFSQIVEDECYPDQTWGIVMSSTIRTRFKMPSPSHSCSDFEA
ncbi:hypothetical protein CVT25_009261 [Psilocybe cyanescens]|uniref:Uncharacterized protein n=1 Tax=Psilocybe cyanescens TaxID=93625 RepID=A0A409XTQ3_PSICY|nr:hypothetical protein CVT25_009261 [Psilocybe cyanescens]